MRTGVDRGEIGAAVRIAGKVGQEGLLDATRDSCQFVNGLLQTVDICRTCARGASEAVARRGDIIKISQAVPAIEANDRLNDVAAEEAPAIIVYVEPEVDTGVKRVCAMDPGEVVYELRRRDRALGVR